MSATMTMTEPSADRRRPRPDPGRRRRGRPVRAARRRTALRRRPVASAAGSSVGPRPSSSPSSSSDSGRRRRSRVVVVGVAVVVGSSSAFGGVRGRRRGPRRARALRAGAAPPGSRRTGRASSAESTRSSADQGRWSAFDGTAEAVEDGLGELVGAHRRGPRRLEPERGPDRQRRAPRARRVVGRGDRPEAHLEPAVVLEDQARQRPGDRRAETGRAAGRAAARRSGATSRKLTTPSSSATQRIASHQPSGASEGRDIPARRRRSPMRTGVLAQERRAGRRQAFGHAAQDSRARPGRSGGRSPSVGSASAGARRLGAASAVSAAASAVSTAAAVSAAASAVSAAAASRRRRRPRRSAAARRARPRPSPSRRLDGLGSSTTRPSSDGLGRSAIGLGLEVRDLGLELEPQHLAPDGRRRAARGPGVGRSRRRRSGESPLIHDRSRLRWRVGVLARTIASASIAVTPGTSARQHPTVRCAPHDGQVDGRPAAAPRSTTGRRASAVSLPSVMGSVTPAC